MPQEEALRNADSASNLSSLVDFSERTDTQKVPVFSPTDAQKGSSPGADFNSIKLNLNNPK